MSMHTCLFAGLILVFAGCGHARLTSPNSAARTYPYSKDIHINYEFHGQGAPIVLLHGFGASLETWRDITPLLEADHTLYLVDMKGFGRSSKPNDRRYSPDDQAEIVNSFLQEVVGQPAVLAGNSLGGAVAIKACMASSTDRITSLVLIDAAAYPQRLPFFIAVLRWPILNHLVLQLPAKWQARLILNTAFYDRRKVTEDRVERHAQFLHSPGSHTALITTAKQLLPQNADDFLKRLPTITVPALVIWGNQDRIIPVQNANRLHQDLKNSTLALLDMTGHVPQEERPKATAESIRNFLRR
jgi:pimeloyl-ACP methyl ester carboxylesterase